ncbi:MAG: efflux RND transporter periplasmic adaptor subunit [Elusimicrobiota bacterium]
MRKVIIWVVVVLFIGLIGYRVTVSIGKFTKKTVAKTEDTGVPVEVVKVRTGDIADRLNLTGNVMANETVNVYAKVPGKLQKYLVSEGDNVAVDQVVAMVNRDEPGFDYAESPVKTNIAGIVSKRYPDIGALVSPAAGGAVAMATPVITVVNIDKVKVVVDVVEKDVAKVSKDLSAQVKVDAYPKRTFTGTVTSVSPMIDQMSRTAKIEITVDNTERLLRPGMFANVDILVSYHSGRILVPVKCIIEKPDGTKRVMVIKSNIAEDRAVTVGFTDNNNAEILSGLKYGEYAVSTGQQRLTNGIKAAIISGGEKE